ncbi:hypothetical protein ACFXGT_03330 [Streptomyces sp. NPDC059352]|uniref:hypothetical protein n=1 Tax=Streptomyces sp. NPDC059352 TaxID=3346810 RepID=UPI003674EC91
MTGKPRRQHFPHSRATSPAHSRRFTLPSKSFLAANHSLHPYLGNALPIWHVNATLRGGGVSEVLHALVRHSKNSETEHRRIVTDSATVVFNAANRLHHRIHGVDRPPFPTAHSLCCADPRRPAWPATPKRARCWTT